MTLPILPQSLSKGKDFPSSYSQWDQPFLQPPPDVTSGDSAVASQINTVARGDSEELLQIRLWRDKHGFYPVFLASLYNNSLLTGLIFVYRILC